MKRKPLFLILIWLAIVLGALTWLFFYSSHIAVLNPQGIIALKQRNLMFLAIGLMLIVVIPVFVMTIYFSLKYRATNTEAPYMPNWADSWLAEAVWWGVPFIIIVILSIVTWQSSHELDPFNPIEQNKKPLMVQVVALQWKWLFIYPEQNIATVNILELPEQTPVVFEITADAPMNSFWIPQLSGQVYAMPGMKTMLHIAADTTGNFQGRSANLSGAGFSEMTFNTHVGSEEEFQQWVNDAKSSTEQRLNFDAYQRLAKPSLHNSPATFLLEGDLFDQILMKYMMPMSNK
jgi:cytochrome o ubiquinol oxidase subunit II